MISDFQAYLDQLYDEFSQVSTDYAYAYLVSPDDREVNLNDFGVCLTTVNGDTYSVGTCDKKFSLHSLSKPLTYGSVLDEYGEDFVDDKADVEPSGLGFANLSLSLDGIPSNAMINSGAITMASMVSDFTQQIIEPYSRLSGSVLSSDDKVFAVEWENREGNDVLADKLDDARVLSSSADRALEMYLKQCSVQVSAKELSMIAASLSNNGTNPITNEKVYSDSTLKRVLSVMMTSGMYDNSGNWVVKIGAPSKSGVSGGVMTVVPNKFGIAVFSPLLDRHGNSVRAENVLQRMSADLGFHFLFSDY